MKCLQSCFKVFSVNKDSFRTLNSQEFECVDVIAHGFSACIAYSVLNVDDTSGSSPSSPHHNLFFFFISLDFSSFLFSFFLVFHQSSQQLPAS